MATTLEAPTPDLAALKGRQQKSWASGDYAVVASRIVLVAEQLCDTADLRAGWHVLDVATGSGNAAIAAARLGCRVTGVDYVPALLDRGRRRADAEGLRVELVEGDAESLPFADDSFDAVLSVFGSMFAPNHEQTAAELLRVCRPGGTIALASWTPDGFIGELFRTVGAHVPPPAGVRSPMLWGTEGHLRTLFGEGITSLEVTERTFTWRFPSAEQFAMFFRLWYGPTLKAFSALEEHARHALESDLVALARRFDRLGADAIAVPATYTEAVAVRQLTELTLAGRNRAQRLREHLDLFAGVRREAPPRARRVVDEAGSFAPRLSRADRPHLEAAAAIRADVVENGFDAGGAEGALVRADPRVRRIRREVGVAQLAVRAELQHRVKIRPIVLSCQP